MKNLITGQKIQISFISSHTFAEPFSEPCLKLPAILHYCEIFQPAVAPSSISNALCRCQLFSHPPIRILNILYRI